MPVLDASVSTVTVGANGANSRSEHHGDAASAGNHQRRLTRNAGGRRTYRALPLRASALCEACPRDAKDNCPARGCISRSRETFLCIHV